MAADSSSVVDGTSPAAQVEDTPPSSPPTDSSKDETAPNDSFEREEAKALERNLEAERKRKASLKRKRKAVTHTEREAKAKELDNLLKQSAAFADILRGKTNVLGRVGTALDGKTLGDHDLEMATQPKCLVGGTMRDYQLEGVTWMYEVCLQGMSGILADEMGLGKVSCKPMPSRKTDQNRQNHPDNWHHCPAEGTGKLPRPAHHHRTPQYLVKLDRRVSKMGSFYPRPHVPWQPQGAGKPSEDETFSELGQDGQADQSISCCMYEL